MEYIVQDILGQEGVYSSRYIRTRRSIVQEILGQEGVYSSRYIRTRRSIV